MTLLHTDSQAVVCIKPAGVLSEGESEGALPALLSRALAEAGEKNTKIFPVHRLDRETAGVMVYARTQSAAALLSEHIRTGLTKKQYLAVVHGTPEREKDTLSDLLYFDRRKCKSFVVERERKGVKSAVLDYELIGTRDRFSLLKINLHTGRTHQIRVQLSSRGLPLVGDRRYGAPKSDFSGIALLSCSLTLPHPQGGEQMTFTAPFPTDAPWNFFEDLL